MIINRQRRVPVSLQSLEKFLSRARRSLHLSADELTVCLVSNGQIARWNHAYRGKNRPTDVLSFPANGRPRKRGARANSAARKAVSFAASDSVARNYLGDIAIAPAVALRNARASGRSFDDEMKILILHGMLHLLGSDHETDTGQMDCRERRLRRALGLS
jgi:probable rRNA maturation factor